MHAANSPFWERGQSGCSCSLILAAAAGLAWLIRSRLAQAAPVMRSWRAWVIWGLQTLLAALILVLLWQPAITVAELKPQQNIIAVLVDDSRSMAISEDGVTRQAPGREGASERRPRPASTTDFKRVCTASMPCPPASIASRICNPTAPSTRIGDSLKQLSEETSDLPIGAVVLLSDGDDNTGGISADAISALRARHIPVHTVGFGRERAAHDVELDDVVGRPARAGRLPPRRQNHVASTRIRRRQDQPDGARCQHGPSQDPRCPHHHLGRGRQSPDRDLDVRYRRRRRQNAANRRRLRLPGEENTANNTLTRVVNVGSEPRRILYIEGEPRWEYKFIRQAEEDDRMVQIASMVRTSENKIYRQGIADPKELADGFPSRPEDLFAYQGLIIGSVEAGYFTPGQQELIREFVDRRGGGLLLLGGQFALADGGWNASNLTDLLPDHAANPGGHVSSRGRSEERHHAHHGRTRARRRGQHHHPPG